LTIETRRIVSTPFVGIYTNLGGDPDPHPSAVCTELIAAGKRAIPVVDNCPVVIATNFAQRG